MKNTISVFTRFRNNGTPQYIISLYGRPALRINEIEYENGEYEIKIINPWMNPNSYKFLNEYTLDEAFATCFSLIDSYLRRSGLDSLISNLCRDLY